MKKICTFLLVMTMGFSLMACGKKTGGDVNTDEVASVVEISGAEEIESQADDAENADVPDKDAKAPESGKDDSSKDSSAAEKSTDAAAKDDSAAEKSTDAAAKDKSSEDAGATEKSADAATNDTSSADAAAKETSTAEAAAEATTVETPKAPQTDGYGRMIFVGDSRTVDLFSADADEIWGDVHNDIPVFCKNGCQFDYMVNAINSYGIDNFDTLVSWMGCNEFGNFSPYGPYYDQLLGQGKNIVVCTVGPTQDEYLLDDMDWYYYPNQNQINYNTALRSWANSRGVKIIDLYSYINDHSSVYPDPKDGIHYLPQPTTEVWNYIVSQLK